MARTRAQNLREEKPSFFGRHGNVYIYIPNLIGALRCQQTQARSRGTAASGASGRRRHSCLFSHLLADPLPSIWRCAAGYARVAAAVFAFGVAQRNPTACCAAYFASFVCDELDGRFARKFHQCSTLGSGEAAGGRGVW
jgi:hypothetical protein